MFSKLLILQNCWGCSSPQVIPPISLTLPLSIRILFRPEAGWLIRLGFVLLMIPCCRDQGPVMPTIHRVRRTHLYPSFLTQQRLFFCKVNRAYYSIFCRLVRVLTLYPWVFRALIPFPVSGYTPLGLTYGLTFYH